jgi:hypothetical protein
VVPSQPTSASLRQGPKTEELDHPLDLVTDDGVQEHGSRLRRQPRLSSDFLASSPRRPGRVKLATADSGRQHFRGVGLPQPQGVRDDPPSRLEPGPSSKRRRRPAISCVRGNWLRRNEPARRLEPDLPPGRALQQAVDKEAPVVDDARVGAAYAYELRRGDEILSTGRLTVEQEPAPGDEVTVAGIVAHVEALSWVNGEPRLMLEPAFGLTAS